MAEEIPKYLWKDSARERKMMARIERGERKQVLDGRRGKKVQNEERETIEHMWNGCSEMRERKGKKRKEILNEDGRKIGWMQEIWKRRGRIEQKRNYILY
jgi:hypothetical protein